jgi:uncharacterized integral membrane protein
VSWKRFETALSYARRHVVTSLRSLRRDHRGRVPKGMADDRETAREQVLHGELDRQGGKDPLRGSRTSLFWVAVVALGMVLLLLIIFIAQNTRTTTVSFLAWDGNVPVAVALLIAAVAGLFLATLAGALRILQLRRRVRRQQA